jgi:hypothetical protein
MDKNRIVPSLILPEATCLVTLPAIQSSRSVKLQDSKQWLMDWRQARKHVFAAQTERRNQLIDTSTILNQSISEQAQALSSRKFETSKSTLEKWSNIQEHVKNFAFPSPPTSSRMLLVNDQKALNAILSPRYRRQLACQLSDNAMVRDVFSLSKSVTSNAIGCHVNASVIGKKSAVAITARQATTSIKSKIFLTETDEFLQLADSKSHRNSPQKSMCFKEPSNAQMESIRCLSHSLSQKMKLLIDLTGMLALQVLDEHKRRQLRDELESTKLVCVEMRKKLERTGVAKPQFQHNFNFLAADNADLIRRIETLHPLQLLLARTVSSLDSQDEALLKRTQSRLLTNVENVNSMARKNINQLAAENEIAEKDRKLRQKIWIEYTYVILSSYRLLAMKPKMNASHQARNAASSLIAKFLRQKTLNKTLTRQTRAARVLIKAVRNFLHLELKIRKKKDSIKIIAQFLIELRDVHPAAKTIKRFRKRVISIQKMIRHFLMRRNFLYMRMLNRWVKIEDKQRKKHNCTPFLLPVYLLELTWFCCSHCSIQVRREAIHP